VFYFLAMEFNLADLFEGNVDVIGERTALVCGDRRLTYAELEARANKLAHFLKSQGVKPGEHVGMYLYNGPEYVEGLLACLKIRAVPINCNYRYVEDELRYLFDDADLVAVLHQREFIPRLAAIRRDVSKVRTLVMVDDGSGHDASGLGSFEYETAIAGQSDARDFEPRSGDDLFIIYTGGTTGMPKGVMWRQEDMFFSALGAGNPLGDPAEKPEDVAARAPSRDPQIVQFPVPPLIHGAAQLGVFIGFNWGDKVCLIPRFDPHAVWETVQREHVNTLTIVGDAMARPLAEALAEDASRHDLSSLYYFGSTGAVLSQSVKEQLRALLPNTIVTENFGATETGFQGMEAMEDARPKEGGSRFQVMPTSMVVDDELNPIAAGSGTIGKLALRGHVPLGYYKDEEKTKATFFEKDGARWVIPGDLATVDADGSVIVFGRGAVCINSGGEKIYPEEVEQVVRSHPEVYDAMVVGQPDERWGERVVALIQPRPGTQPTLESIDAHCRTTLAGYKVPRAIYLVDEVQRQPSGKPDFTWARRFAAEQVQ